MYSYVYVLNMVSYLYLIFHEFINISRHFYIFVLQVKYSILFLNLQIYFIDPKKIFSKFTFKLYFISNHYQL